MRLLLCILTALLALTALPASAKPPTAGLSVGASLDETTLDETTLHFWAVPTLVTPGEPVELTLTLAPPLTLGDINFAEGLSPACAPTPAGMTCAVPTPPDGIVAGDAVIDATALACGQTALVAVRGVIAGGAGAHTVLVPSGEHCAYLPTVQGTPQ